MKVLVDNSGYSLGNIGDLAMLQVGIRRIKEELKDAEIIVFTLNAEDLENYCPGTLPVPDGILSKGRAVCLGEWGILGRYHRIFPHSLLPIIRLIESKIQVRLPNFTRAILRWRFHGDRLILEEIDNFYSLIKSSDLVLSTGGGFLNDIFEGHAFNVLSTIALAQTFGKPTFMFGQGIGPINSPKLFKFSKSVLSQLSQLSLREAKSNPDFLKSLGISNRKLLVTGDDAIEIAYQFHEDKLGPSIGINLRVADYSGVDQQLSKDIRSVILSAHSKYCTDLVPLPISRNPADSDVKNLLELFEGYIDNSMLQVSSPEQLSKSVSKCRIVITGSYHAGVFALSQGLQVVGLAHSQYYIDKFSGLADQFKHGCHIVHISEANFLENLKNAIDQAWEGADIHRESLLESAKEQIRLSLEAYRELAKSSR